VSSDPINRDGEPADSLEEGDVSALLTTPPPRRKHRLSPTQFILALFAVAIAIDVFAFVFFPPFPADGHPGDACQFPVCYIEGTLEFPAPHVLWPPPDESHAAEPATGLVISAEPTIPSTVFTMWVVGGLLLLGIILMTRGSAGVPGKLQNLGEWAYESLESFGISLGGPAAKRYIPIFVSFFLLILFCNWAGLIPPVGRVEFLRAPTSDVNVTIGLALVAFGIFEFEGFRRLGVGGYLGKFFPLYEFKNGIGAGAIALFVGLIELMLEFVKPLTLSMRLFGNIYGGEVALGVMTSLTLVALPVALLGLEFMLNFIQALIFSVLTLMFIVLAVESHHDEEGHIAEEAVATIEGKQPIPAGAH
jgi:F-type H+-transporting ATPase subunit a